MLFSGGMDSTVCLAWAKTAFRSVLALTIDYGQSHMIEIEQARRIASDFEVEHEVAKVPALIAPKGPVVPSRNMMLLSMAAHYAGRSGARDPAIVFGACAADAELFPDCREAFLIAARAALSLGLGKSLELYWPLLNLSKEAIFAKAERHGVLGVVLEKSHTCYVGSRTTRHEWGYGCGECLACVTRARGWECRKLTLDATRLEGAPK